MRWVRISEVNISDTMESGRPCNLNNSHNNVFSTSTSVSDVFPVIKCTLLGNFSNQLVIISLPRFVRGNVTINSISYRTSPPCGNLQRRGYIYFISSSLHFLLKNLTSIHIQLHFPEFVTAMIVFQAAGCILYAKVALDLKLMSGV